MYEPEWHRKRGGGWSSRATIHGSSHNTDKQNAIRSQEEVTAFLRRAPAKAFVYVNKSGTKVTTWTGDELGRVTHRGSTYKSPSFGGMGNRRRNLTVCAINNRVYSCTEFLDAGTYARCKLTKNKCAWKA